MTGTILLELEPIWEFLTTFTINLVSLISIINGSPWLAIWLLPNLREYPISTSLLSLLFWEYGTISLNPQSDSPYFYHIVLQLLELKEGSSCTLNLNPWNAPCIGSLVPTRVRPSLKVRIKIFCDVQYTERAWVWFSLKWRSLLSN